MVMKNRRLLNFVMTQAGWVNYPAETWHFDFGDQMFVLLSGQAESAIYGFAQNPEGAGIDKLTF